MFLQRDVGIFGIVDGPGSGTRSSLLVIHATKPEFAGGIRFAGTLYYNSYIIPFDSILKIEI